MLVDRHPDQDLGYAVNEGMRWRLGLRSSNAARPHRNHARERQTGQAPWDREDFRDAMYGEEMDDMNEQRDDTDQVQAYIDAGVPVPPGEYLIHRTISCGDGDE